MNQILDHHVARIRRRLNSILFLEHFLAACLFLPLILLIPTLTYHLVLRKPFPVAITLIAGSVALLAYAAFQTGRNRYASTDARALLDSWLGGYGNALVGLWRPTGSNNIPLPHLRWRPTLSQLAPAVLAAIFLCNIPVLPPPAVPAMAAINTRRIEERLQTLDELALLTPEKLADLKSSLKELHESAENMTTEEFWHASDKLSEQISQSIAESQSVLDAAAAELAKLADSAAIGPAAESAPIASPEMTEALANLLKSLPPGAVAPGLSDKLAKELSQLMDAAKAGDISKLAQAWKQLSPAELAQLARSLGQCNTASLMAGHGNQSGNQGIGNLSESLEAQLAASLYETVKGSGQGGINRGPGTNNRLFGDESQDLSEAMHQALLPSTNQADPGELLQRTPIPAAPAAHPSNPNQPAAPGSAVIGQEQTAGRATEIPPRYRNAVGLYFQNQPATSP